MDIVHVFTPFITSFQNELDLKLLESYGFSVAYNVSISLQRSLKYTDIMYAYNKIRSIPIGWEHRISIEYESSYSGTIETNYIMFKYIVNNVEKTCLCIVIDDVIVSVYNSDVQI